MKLVAIQGSPHGMTGSTGLLLRGLVEEAEKKGSEAVIFSLGAMKIRPCVGCGECHKTGACVIRDDFAAINKAIMASDAIVVASPNYLFSVTAQTKAFLDRCSCHVHCQALESKYGAAVVTSGGGGSDQVGEYVLRVLRSFGCWTVGTVGALAMEMSDDKMRKQRQKEAAELASRLGDAVTSKASYADQAKERQAFAQRMMQLVNMHKDEWTYEYEHWRARARA